MPSYTASLRLIQPATGEYSGTWGTQVNTGITALVDSSIAGTTSITMTAANYTLTTANGAADESRAMFLVIGGTPGAAREVIVPAVSKLYFVTNNTTGGFAQTVKTALGSGISVPNGASMVLRCDGTNVVDAITSFSNLTLSGSISATKFIPTGGTATGNGMYLPAANTLAWSNNSAETMRLDASGNLGVGTASPSTKLHVGGAGSTYITVSSTNASTGSGLFTSNATNSYLIGAGAASGLSGLEFRDITNSATRMVLDTSGNLLVGATSQPNPSYTSRIAAVQPNANSIASMDVTNASGGFGIILRYTAASPNNTGNEAFNFADSSSARFQVRSNGGIANFSGNNVNLSDRREKTNFAPAEEYLSKICAIPVQTFNYIDQNMEEDPGLTLGAVAQDVQAVAPELVMESNWGTAEEPKMRLSIYQTDLQYALMKCIQEQQAIIEDLRARVAALEAA